MTALLNPAWIVAVAAMWTFHVAAAYETRKAHGSRANELLWPLLSIVVSFIVIRGFEGGVVAVLAAQVLAFIGIGVWRAARS